MLKFRFQYCHVGDIVENGPCIDPSTNVFFAESEEKFKEAFAQIFGADYQLIAYWTEE